MGNHYYRDHPERIKTIVPYGWTQYVSINGVSHAVPPTGPCATCGRGRHDYPNSAEDNQADIRDKYIARYGQADHERLEQIVLLTVGVIDR